jgi:hypothetical protein
MFQPLHDVLIDLDAPGEIVRSGSSAVKGVPSCQTTPCLRRQMTQVPSRARPPFSTLGISCARIGMKSPSGSMEINGS